MLTNHKPSRMDSRGSQAAALVGGMGRIFMRPRNPAWAYQLGRALCHLRKHICAPLKISQRVLADALRGFQHLPQVVQCVFFPAFKKLLPHPPAVRAILITTLAILLLPGCVSAHKKGRTIHERFDYSIIQFPGCEARSLLICHEIWKDEWTGGGRAFLADPKASELVSLHTNQTALGGSSTLTIGSFQSEVSTNGIRAAGDASSQIIQGIGSAAGQLINKTVTGTPLK